MLRDVRRFEWPALSAFHDDLMLRTPSLRVSFHRGRNVVSDYGLLQRLSPFLHTCTARSAVSVVLEGNGRFEEQGRRTWLRPGGFTLSDERRGGTEAYDGAWLNIGWDSSDIGAPHAAAFAPGHLSPRDLARVSAAAHHLAGPTPEMAIEQIFAIFRAAGLPLERVPVRVLANEPDAMDQRLVTALNDHLVQLERYPAVDEVAAAVGASPRFVHRHIGALASRYSLRWSHWRGALHHQRMLQALRLLATPGATTEGVARLTGFRSPTALCHAFAKGGLPSPGALARAARADALERWSAHATPPEPSGAALKGA